MRLSDRYNNLSLLVCLVLCISVVFFRFVYPPVNILSWDVFGFYLYLPAGFIYHDIGLHDLSWVNAIVEKYQPTDTLYQLYSAQEGGWVIKVSMGMAVLNAPAFIAGHLYSILFHFPSDGFSLPYQYAFAISGLIYAIIGIFMLRKILLEYFDEITASAILLIVVAGTNHFQLTAFDGMLSHNYLFTLYTFILWFTIRWHKQQKLSYAVFLGLSMGMAILTRPSEMVCILIPLLWGIHNRETLVMKWKMVTRNWKHLFVLAGIMFLTGLPQLIYWKTVTGQWLYYSYNNPGEGFDFLSPYILQFLFSFRKGWLIYTPVMIFALAGLYSLYRHQKPALLAITVYFLINLWMYASWTAWWYGGGSYSQRALLPSYVILSIPLGYLINGMRRSGISMRSLGFSILLILVLLNIFQTWQWANGIIDKTRMTRAYYFAIFGKTKVDPADRHLLMIDQLAEEVIPSDKSGLVYRQLVFRDYESAAQQAGMEVSDTAFSGSYSLRMVPSSPFAAGFETAYKDLTKKEYAWIKVSIRVFPLKPVKESPASLVASFEHTGGVYKYKAESLSKEEYGILPGRWNLMSIDYLTPDVRSKDDKLKVYFWLQGNTPMLIDDFKVEMWEPKEQ